MNKIKEYFLHSIGTISLVVALGALLNLMNFTGYYAGYTVGAFFVMYLWAGMFLIEIWQREK